MPVSLRTATIDDLEWIIASHVLVYKEEEGFDEGVAELVRLIAGAFFEEHEPDRERGWIAEVDNAPMGCVFCIRDTGTDSIAKLRLFLVMPEARGTGIGHKLHDTCVAFARDAGYSEMSLWTHTTQDAAEALYRAKGWRPVRETETVSFGQDVVERTWQLDLDPLANPPAQG